MADWWYSPSRAARVVWFKCVFSVHCSRRGCLLNADEISKLGPRLIHARALCQCLKLHGAWGRHRVHHLEIIASDLQEKKERHTHTHRKRHTQNTDTDTEKDRQREKESVVINNHTQGHRHKATQTKTQRAVIRFTRYTAC